ncbi:hypothetical protein GOODEAATRI_019846, partial [Goodea atripinnis]
LIEEELKPHLDTVLTALLEKSESLEERTILYICVSTEKDAAVDIVRSGILPTLAQALQSRSSLSCQVALLVAEMAREGLVKALVPHLNSKDQEMLLNTGRAIGRICFDNNCAREALVEQDVADTLIFQLKRAPDAERRHVILEILGSLGESDESMQKCFGEGSGVVYQDILSWLQSSNTQLQLSGALAIANFARNATNKVRMLEDGVSERIKTLLRTDMPPVQFKLLGTLRMMVDGQ